MTTNVVITSSASEKLMRQLVYSERCDIQTYYHVLLMASDSFSPSLAACVGARHCYYPVTGFITARSVTQGCLKVTYSSPPPSGPKGSREVRSTVWHACISGRPVSTTATALAMVSAHSSMSMKVRVIHSPTVWYFPLISLAMSYCLTCCMQ